MLDSFKRVARKVLQRTQTWLDPSSRSASRGAHGREMAGAYYDEAFSESAHFQAPYFESRYYPTWLVVVDRLRRYGCERILDVGCGPGQFAALCASWGFPQYTGLDFSTVALNMARNRAPKFEFRQGDVTDRTLYQGIEFEAIVCMELLEHVQNDLQVIECYPTGTRCLMTVPNFPWRSHVRHFETADATHQRYGRFFDDFSVTTIQGFGSAEHRFYLLDGIRNATLPVAETDPHPPA